MSLISKFSLAVFVAAVTLGASTSEALIEVKGGYSMHTTSPGGLNNQFPSNPKIEQLQSISVDVMGNVPLMPVGLGVRYESLKRNETGVGVASEVDWSRTSILVNKRLLDTLFYLGPIATFSVASDFKYRSTTAGVRTDYKSDSQLTITGGVEAGAKLALLRIGAEVGYFYAPMGELKTSAGVPVTDGSGSKVTFDMSGPYARVVVGFGF